MGAWYDEAIIYQIYPKSFQDSNGDGVGDLRGIQARIPYLQALGINCVWLNPVFASPQVDNGYDVANYYAIDERLGTMADMEALIKALHQAKIRVVLDFVVNHTSDQHPWFQDAIQTPHSLYRDYYIFQNGPAPNNWGSFFGGSVWEEAPDASGQMYFHLFDKHMPDLNWANPEVRHAMQDVAEFWLHKGLDGLRVDAFIHIAKANLAQDFPTTAADEPVVAEPFFANLPQVQTWLKPFVAQLKADFPDAFLLGEAASASVDLASAYTDHLMDAVVSFRYFTQQPGDVGLPAAYQPKMMDWQAFKQTQAVWQQTLMAYPTLYWSNHDMGRVLGRVAQSATHARSLAMLMYLQRGLPIIYYGEELGMQNLQFTSADDFKDPTVAPFVAAAVNHGLSEAEALAMVSATHKLPARAPMQWDDAPHHGFSTQTPWLSGQELPTASAAAQQLDRDSMWQFYRQLIELKKRHLFQTGDYLLLTTDENSYVYQRQTPDAKAIVAVGLGQQPAQVTLPKGRYSPLLWAGDYQLNGAALTLAPEAGVVLIEERSSL
ncbi:alpha-glucosidase [Lacticaseibacillus jixiensis]|uniref:alpha-glucosidase n=1 Tax=Lacticaseibacillus jixiensis TaxID=3231926 RepID=UPI0036F1DE08